MRQANRSTRWRKIPGVVASVATAPSAPRSGPLAATLLRFEGFRTFVNVARGLQVLLPAGRRDPAGPKDSGLLRRRKPDFAFLVETACRASVRVCEKCNRAHDGRLESSRLLVTRDH